jgi:hypothetical protein
MNEAAEYELNCECRSPPCCRTQTPRNELRNPQCAHAPHGIRGLNDCKLDIPYKPSLVFLQPSRSAPPA